MNELYKLSENSAPQILGRNKASKNASERSDENKSQKNIKLDPQNMQQE